MNRYNLEDKKQIFYSAISYSVLTALALVEFKIFDLKEEYLSGDVNFSTILWPFAFISSLSGAIYFIRESYNNRNSIIIPASEAALNNFASESAGIISGIIENSTSDATGAVMPFEEA